MYLTITSQFSETIGNVDGGRYLVLEKIPFMGQNCGHTGADIGSFDQGNVSNLNSFNIGYCIMQPGWQHTNPYSQTRYPGPILVANQMAKYAAKQ